MAWYSNITQFADWNKVSGNPEVEYLLALQGVGADEGKTLFFNSSLSSVDWEITFPVIREGHPSLIAFTNGMENPEFAGYFYNGEPCFVGFDGIIFKSYCGRWVYSKYRPIEPNYFFTSANTAIWNDDVEDGADIRTLQGISCSINEVYETTADIGSSLDVGGHTYDFVEHRTANSETLETTKKQWRRTEGQQVERGGADEYTFRLLSDYLGEWTCNEPEEDPVVIGNGLWVDGYTFIRMDSSESEVVKYLVTIVDQTSSCVFGVKLENGDYVLDEVYDYGTFPDLTLDSFSLEAGQNASVMIRYAGGKFQKTVPWAGWTIPATSTPTSWVKYTHHPWLRPVTYGEE